MNLIRQATRNRPNLVQGYSLIEYGTIPFNGPALSHGIAINDKWICILMTL